MTQTSNKTRAYLSYAFIAIVWGTTYLAIKVAVASYPPFLMAGVRQVVSAIIMLIIAACIGQRADFNRRALLQNAIIGFLMIALGNGVVSWAETVVPSGVAALVCSTMPIWVVLINLSLHRTEKLSLPIVAGILLGFGGVALIFSGDLAHLGESRYLAGIGALLAATLGWGGGSVLSKRWGGRKNPMADSAVQVGFGGLFLLLASPFTDNYAAADWFDTDAFASLLYLIVFGSVIAFTAYRYALKELPVGFVTSYAYVNPLVAVVLGYFVGEATSAWTALSFAAIIAGVFLVNHGYRRQQEQARREEALRAFEQRLASTSTT